MEAICKWPAPTNMMEVRSFLGFTNYCQQFIKKYAQVAKPLYKLILGENASRKHNPIKWDLECQTAFDQLNELCTTTPVLAYVDFTKPFKLHTNANVLGLGAVLHQVHEGVISYASRSLTQSEPKYPVHKLEFLCLKWAITEQFHEYLYGNTFDIYTDNNPLTYVLMTAKLDAMGNRWVTSLANYNFHLHYQAEDQVIRDLIQQYGTRELHKGKDKDSPGMKQFLWQRGKLIVRNGILYHKNDTKESKYPSHEHYAISPPYCIETTNSERVATMTWDIWG